jgi:hypothetical protein
MNKFYLTILDRDRLPEHYYRESYGKTAMITRLGKINIVHLDFPSESTIQERIAEVITEQSSRVCDCTVCREYKDHPLDVIYPGVLDRWLEF